MGIPRPILYIGGTPATPTVAEPSPVQTTLPTSAYGQTIPVVYGKARLPAAYIWVAPIVTVTETHVEWYDKVTTTTSAMTARLRFARPLVPDSTWAVRRIWAQGRLIYDASTGYRTKGLRFRFYDGRSTQGRDPSEAAEEGTNNVSAHRGYLDIVFDRFNIIDFGAPPVFEAEFVQDASTDPDIDSFETFFSDAINTVPAVDWDSQEFYGVSNDSSMIRRFSITGLREIYAIGISGLGRAYFSLSEMYLRYVPEIDRLVAIGIVVGPSGGAYPILLDPATGLSVAEGDNMAIAGESVNAAATISFGNSWLLLTSSFILGYVAVFRYDATSMARVSLSGANWDGVGRPTCFTPGEARSDTADVWICVADTLYNVVVNSSGLLLARTAHATFADDLLYAVFYDDDVIVWTDNLQAIRVDGATGATVWTKTVPYQIPIPTSSGLGFPDANRLDDEFFIQDLSNYYFTSLITGVSRTVSKTTEISTFRYVYDGLTGISVTTDNVVAPFRRFFNAAGNGTQRNLSDFLEALTIEGGFGSSQVQCINVDDLIDGAVIDVTAGVRDIARSTCEPYSIAIFERPGEIVYKRAATDGSFAVDESISSAGDLMDSGGQAIKAKRQNPEEFVSRYGINYRDPDQVYQARPQYGEIPVLPFPVAPSDDSVKASIPIIVDGDTIKTLATKKVNHLAIERHEFTMTLRAKFADLEPEDIIQFTFANRLITARVVEATIRPDYMIDILATEFLSSTSVSISGASGRPIEPTPVGTPSSRYYHLDIPLLSDSHDRAGAGLVQYHVLSSAGQLYWDGATLYRRDTSGQFQPVAQQTIDGLVGVALEVLPDWDTPYVTEFSRTLNVSFISGDKTDLTSATYLEMMNGANFFAIGQPGRWEVCQVMTITQNLDGTTTFEGLARGRKTSEEYTALHEIGDFVVMLNGANVQRMDYTIANLDQDFDFKAVGFGGTVTSTPTVTRTVTGEAEKIPKPCQLAASIDSPSDVRLSWVRRSRIGSYWVDDGGYTAPLGETLEQYVVRIKNAPGGTVLRTVTVNNATLYDYSGALQTTDFGSPLTSGDRLTFDIRQVSGTGVICPTREATIDL